MLEKFWRTWDTTRWIVCCALVAIIGIHELRSHAIDIHIESAEEHDAHERDAAAFDSRDGNDTYYHDEGTPPAGDANHHYHDGHEVFDA